MAKQIKVTDKAYEKLKALAESHGMQVATFVSFMASQFEKAEQCQQR